MTEHLRIEFDLRERGQRQPDAFLDCAELERLFASTRETHVAGLRRKFAGVVCAEHGCAPSFKISGVYDHDIESLELQYHVDTCCQAFLLRVMRLLNRRA